MSTEEELSKKDKEPKIEEVGGVHGWLLKKAKTFMWDASSNKLILPKGVVLSVEEKAALEDLIGEIKDEAVEVEKRKLQQMASMQQAGVILRANVVKGYDLLMSGSYRELTGVLAQKVHDNLQDMMMVNKRFLSGVWKVISGLTKTSSEKDKAPIVIKGRDGR